YDALRVTSHNGISIMMLVACISLYIVLNIEKKEINLLPALLTLIISIWGIGRAGIISSLVLLLGLLSIKFVKRKKIIGFTIVIIIIGSLYINQITNIILNSSFFFGAVSNYLAKSSVMGPEERILIWENYFYNLDYLRILFGTNVFTDQWAEGFRLAYNYHNAFIALHSQTGFMGIIIMMIIIISLFKFYKTDKVFFFLFLTLVIRSYTDTFIFFESWDFIAYYFIFYFLIGIKNIVPRSLSSNQGYWNTLKLHNRKNLSSYVRAEVRDIN
ncbi:MAG: Uncharacterized protein FD136_254, partial [Chitinophagaceae bacterium]